ncbi:unnamed protein product [Microthlaspi erraticum]|uniref:Uncharacterized protein n=1 Tax=Microthlaspi erraticum TaxID=1685480 RepID=A0A6D2JCG9_9BRAS|nr:unnamed protein product [Microthlaspi erraticum]CAA7039275.1 unnamed protein product [Microthlaspi erraticum]
MNIEYNEEHYRGVDEYWRKVAESDGFDIEGIKGPLGMIGLMTFECEGLDSYTYAYPSLVHGYAKMGLHLYNMLKGTNLEFHSLMKFNMLQNLVSSYFITLEAYDPLGQLLPFQVHAEENLYCSLDFTVFIARPKRTRGAATTSQPISLHGRGVIADGLPDWPSEDIISDRQRFFELEEHVVRNTSWIQTYLELTVYTKDRFIPREDLYKLKIVKVVMETGNADVEPPNQRLNAKNETFYITLKGLAIRGTGEHVERKAIVRRVVNGWAVHLSLKGELCSREEDLVKIMSWEEKHRRSLETGSWSSSTCPNP